MSILNAGTKGNNASILGLTDAANAKEERKPSMIWLNIGVNIPGAAEDGTDLFVSLPVGVPLDDMKQVKVRGNNANFVALQQAKNKLLEELQAAGASMEPGQRQIVPQLSVEIARVSENSATGDANTPLLGLLTQALRQSA